MSVPFALQPRQRNGRALYRFGACAAILGIVTACAPIVQTHGYAPIEEDLALIVPGEDTRGSVRRKIGRPGGTGVFTDEGWFYVATVTEQHTYKAPKVAERRVVAVLFDQRDVVTSVDRYSLADGRIVDLETNTTPTLGRELTILEQTLGNIGVFNAADLTSE